VSERKRRNNSRSNNRGSEEETGSKKLMNELIVKFLNEGYLLRVIFEN
jgi:hypothetical protein